LLRCSLSEKGELIKGERSPGIKDMGVGEIFAAGKLGNELLQVRNERGLEKLWNRFLMREEGKKREPLGLTLY